MDMQNVSDQIDTSNLGTSTLFNAIDLDNIGVDNGDNNETLNKMRDRIDDMFILLSRVSVDMSAIMSKQDAILAKQRDLDQRIEAISSNVNRTAATVLSSVDDSVVSDTSASGQHTRQISKLVPAAVIRSLWHDNKPGCEFPVAFKYLAGLCDASFPMMSSTSKSELGVLLQVHIDSIETLVESGNNIVEAISTNTHNCYADMRRCLLETIKLLGGDRCYMLPHDLVKILNRVDTISAGKFVLRSYHDPKEMLGSGQGYDTISQEYITRPYVMKAYKASVSHSGKSKVATKRFLKALLDKAITTDGKLTEAVKRVGKPLGSLLKSTPDNKSNTSSTSTDIDILEFMTPVKFKK